MPNRLEGKNIAILATDGFEQSELLEPRKALEENGAKTYVISLKPGKIKGWDQSHGRSLKREELRAAP